MIVKEHTRNQKRMYRIHKQEEKIHDLELLVGTLQQENKKCKEVIDKAKSLNEEISHIIYEDFLEENVIGCKYLYERIKKQLDILKEVK